MVFAFEYMVALINDVVSFTHTGSAVIVGFVFGFNQSNCVIVHFSQMLCMNS